MNKSPRTVIHLSVPRARTHRPFWVQWVAPPGTSRVVLVETTHRLLALSALLILLVALGFFLGGGRPLNGTSMAATVAVGNTLLARWCWGVAQWVQHHEC